MPHTRRSITVQAYDIVLSCPHALQSVINRPLLERLDLLKAAIAPPPPEGILVGKGTVKGSLAKLIPSGIVLEHTVCSKICHSMEDIQAAFDEAVRVQVRILQHSQPCDSTLQSIFSTALAHEASWHTVLSNVCSPLCARQSCCFCARLHGLIMHPCPE